MTNRTIINKIKNSDTAVNNENKNMFASIINACNMGNVMCNTQKQRNEWKVRMLNAGLGEGLHLPEDWDKLDEQTKEDRLNKAIEALK